jgi:hypothetical protein
MDILPVDRGHRPRRLGCHAGKAKIKSARPNKGMKLTQPANAKRRGLRSLSMCGSVESTLLIAQPFQRLFQRRSHVNRFLDFHSARERLNRSPIAKPAQSHRHGATH